MAAPDNVNRAQFPKDHHKTVLSSIEDSFGMRITPVGIEHEGRIIPTGGMSSVGSLGRRRDGKERDDDYFFRASVLREDPRHRDGLSFIIKPSASSDGGSHNYVHTSQYHDYPVYDDTGEPLPDQHLGLRRHQRHDDLPSALQYLSESADQRSKWLEMKSAPPHGPTDSWGGDVGEGSISPFASKPRSPKTIDHDNANDDGSFSGYQVDTGTRERIPEEDW